MTLIKRLKLTSGMKYQLKLFCLFHLCWVAVEVKSTGWLNQIILNQTRLVLV